VKASEKKIIADEYFNSKIQ